MKRKQPCAGDHGRTLHKSRRDPTFRLALASVDGVESLKPEDEPRWGAERVYFLHVPEIRRVKIGWSRDPESRRRALSQGFGNLPSVLLGTLNGGRILERLMHERFEDERVSGEWFSDAIIPEARSLIRADRDFFGVAA